jgi:hypothetical protein
MLQARRSHTSLAATHNSNLRYQAAIHERSIMNDHSHDAGASDGGKDRYLWAVIIAFALLALPHSPFQDTFKILAWTAVVFGVYTPYVWPHLFDTRSRAVFALVCMAHLAIVYEMYSRIPHDGFIFLGVAAIVELILFSVPGGWIIVHSRTHRDKMKGCDHEE